MDLQKLAENAWLGFSQDSFISALTADRALIDFLSALSEGTEAGLQSTFARAEEDTHRPRLFGTSGIRGLFRENIPGNAASAYLQSTDLTMPLAYFLGRAVVRVLGADRTQPIWLASDVRRSSLALMLGIIRGVIDEGGRVSVIGIAPTPIYTLNTSTATILVTASHNPIQFNGFKVFHNNRPIPSSIEKKLEALIIAFSEMSNVGKKIRPEKPTGSDAQDDMISVSALEIERRYFTHLLNIPVMGRLRIESGTRLENRFLPLDLAFGSAACPVSESGSILRISPAIAVFLSLGIPVIGYGCTQNSDRTNVRIGAAYAYGETPDAPRMGELAKFVRGLPGYGAPAHRIAFLPEGFASNNENLTDRLVNTPDSSFFRCIPIHFPDYQAISYAVALDGPGIDSRIASEVESEIMKRRPLPGLMVDCDADRILITAPEISKSDTPYLSGDAMIRFFAETMDPDEFTDVIYTVESGLSVEIALTQTANKLSDLKRNSFNCQTVTVGDRSIIDFMATQSSGRFLGGEPSGHMIFGEILNGRLQITDDPFITYLRLIDRTASERFDLDWILARFFWDVPEVYCSRKPDARTQTGISLNEKRALDLWEFGRPGQISQYARLFIPAYIDLFASAYSSGFLDNSAFSINPTTSWTGLLEKSFLLDPNIEFLTIALIEYSECEPHEKLRVDLRVPHAEWAGIDVIRLEFHLLRDSHTPIKMGEGVFRNSGTSPKNSGYHKLWPIHPIRHVNLSEGALRELLDDLSARRAQWTERFVVEQLRQQR